MKPIETKLNVNKIRSDLINLTHWSRLAPDGWLRVVIPRTSEGQYWHCFVAVRECLDVVLLVLGCLDCCAVVDCLELWNYI